MPDKWEYPWYAAWDLAFHTIALALVDPEFAKGQLTLFLREWYMHPNGQIPAYEWALGDVNPPVHAWAAWRVYKIDRKRTGRADRQFLEGVFHKLLLNFNWWVNRKDAEGMNVFQGGFLGLDNIGVFDRSAALPTGGHIEQSDGTSWMAMFSLNMLAISLELARENPAYEGVASKFFEHFVQIAHAMDKRACSELSLWDEEDGFFYDALHLPGGDHQYMKVRSLVGLIPLLAVETLEPDVVAALPGFQRRLEWFVGNRPEFREHLETMDAPGGGVRRLLSIVSREQLPRVLHRMLDEREFLAPHGIRAVSRHHQEHPYVLAVDGREYRVDYEPAESTTGLFGGNSNWRGPIWFPINYLLIEALQESGFRDGVDGHGHRLFAVGATVGRPSEPRGHPDLLALGQGAGLGRAPLRHGPVRRCDRRGRARGGPPGTAACGSSHELRGHRPRDRRRRRGVRSGAPHDVPTDDGDPDRHEPPRPEPLHRVVRRDARPQLHRLRSAGLGDEPQSGTHPGLGRPRSALGRASDQHPDCARGPSGRLWIRALKPHSALPPNLALHESLFVFAWPSARRPQQPRRLPIPAQLYSAGRGLRRMSSPPRRGSRLR
jgi:hypothetical protein